MSHPAIPVRIQIFEKSPKMNGKVESCRRKAHASCKAVRRNLVECEAYLRHVAMTKDEIQRRGWSFYEAVKVERNQRYGK